MMNRTNHKLFAPLRWMLPSVLAIACSSDCVAYPCPALIAGNITVTASNSSAAIPGLTLSLSGAPGVPCDPGASRGSICHVLAGIGVYDAQLSAPGYQTTTMKVTVTGTSAGCNTCGHIDQLSLSVVMQPASAAD